MSACGCDTGGLKPVDEAIAEMQKDGSLKALSEKWFGADVTK